MKKQEATLHFQDSRERSEGGRAMFLLFVIELERCRSELGSFPLILLFFILLFIQGNELAGEAEELGQQKCKTSRYPRMI